MRARWLAVVVCWLAAACGRPSAVDWEDRLFTLPSKTYSFDLPEGATAEQVVTALRAAHSGEPQPPGFSIAIYRWRSELRDTGETVPGTRERICELIIETDPRQLVRANVWIDGRLAATASRSQGIDDVDGVARAELRFALPPKGYSYRVRVERFDDAGGSQSTEGAVPGLRWPWSTLLGWMFR
jgi:hypothetical protein